MFINNYLSIVKWTNSSIVFVTIQGIIGFCGITDAEAKPILLCSCNDNSVRLYELPSFTERGRIYAKAEVRTIQIGTGGLFFTGDAMGELTVWKLNEKSSTDESL